MTLFLASVTGPEEAETVIAGGADVIDLKDPAAGALGALPPARVRETVAGVAGRRRTSGVTGDLPMIPDRVHAAVEAMAATGVDFVKVGLFPEEGRPAVIEALRERAKEMRLIGVLFADLEFDPTFCARLADAGFAGVMLDTAVKGKGRLLDYAHTLALAAFISAARNGGLTVGLAGALEAPDVPRLLPLRPDFLGFRGALTAGEDRTAGIDAEQVRFIRALIPHDVAPIVRPDKVDYRLLSARGYGPELRQSDGGADRIFVRDLVLPVRIGAYSHERDAEQKVRFDVVVEVTRAARLPSDMRDVLSYDVIIDGIRLLVAERHIDLVETLAEEIAGLVLDSPRARRVTVRVEKLELGPGGVGVEIVRERAAEAADARPSAFANEAERTRR